MSAGKSIAHDSAALHVTGEANYVDDIPGPSNQLHVAIGSSKIASGHIVSMDLTEVESAEGVVDVITAADLPAETDIGPVFPGDPLLCSTEVSHFGQPVFAVVAETHQLARQAVELASIQYQQKEPVLDVETAMLRRSYVRPPYTIKRGDAHSAIKKAAHRLTGKQSIGGQEHFYLEGQAAVAWPDERGGVQVTSSNQNPTEAQHIVAKVLGIPMHRITVTTRRMGGGFGGKETQANLCCALAAVVAVKHQRVISCRLSRRDDMLMTGKRHGFYTEWEVGFDNNGVIEGVRFTLAGQCGHSPDLSDAIVDRAMFHCDNAYFYPAVQIEGLRCRTNTVSNTAFRGFGGPQGMLACESMMDQIALHLKKDPLEVRKRNFFKVTDRNVTPYGQVIDHFSVPTIVQRLEASAQYTSRREAIAEFNDKHTVLKRGISLTPVKFGISFTVKHLNQGGALLHLYSDGSVQLNHGGTEMGQGLMVKVQQIVAHTLGMNHSRISITATRTDKVPNTSPTAASSGTDINGAAAQNAALKLKKRLVDFLVLKHQLNNVDEVSFGDDKVLAGNESYSWEALANAAYLDRVPLSATGFYKTPNIHFDRELGTGQPFYYFANGAAITEVVIDTLTGENRILRTDIVHDVGQSVNPAMDIGQIEGGYIQGAGWLTHEELAWADDGRLMTDGPANYKIPAISDAPAEFNVTLLDDAPNDVATVFRSKAVGEPPLMLAISVFCAIKDAVYSANESAKNLDAPATPEAILRALDEDW